MNLMFPFSYSGFGWGWGWGLAATIAGLIVLAVLLIPWFFFLLSLNNLLEEVAPRNRAMSPGQVWLNFIPVFNLGWFIYTVVKVKDSVKAEYAARGWAPDGDFGYNVGLIAGVLGILSVLGVIPFLGWMVSVAALICWIVYWLKVAELKKRLQARGMSQPGASQGYPGGLYAPPPPPPARPASPPSYAPQTGQQAPPPAAAPGAGQTQAPSETEAPSGAAETPAESRGQGVCAACGTPYSPSDAFCRTCGLKLP